MCHLYGHMPYQEWVRAFQLHVYFYVCLWIIHFTRISALRHPCVMFSSACSVLSFSSFPLLHCSWMVLESILKVWDTTGNALTCVSCSGTAVQRVPELSWMASCTRLGFSTDNLDNLQLMHSITSWYLHARQYLHVGVRLAYNYCLYLATMNTVAQHSTGAEQHDGFSDCGRRFGRSKLLKRQTLLHKSYQCDAWNSFEWCAALNSLCDLT